MSFDCQALGAIAAIVAMAAGFADYVALPRAHPAADTAVFHMLAMGGAWLLFVSSLALRGLPASEAPPHGRLVYRFGVGVSSDPPTGRL